MPERRRTEQRKVEETQPICGVQQPLRSLNSLSTASACSFSNRCWDRAISRKGDKTESQPLVGGITNNVPSPTSVQMRRWCNSRNRWGATVGFAALVALTRRTAEAQNDDEPNPAYGTYRLIGCFKDERDRAMPYVANPSHVTQDSCSALCVGAGYAYMGLQFGHEW